jgi:hypothetical protein
MKNKSAWLAVSVLITGVFTFNLRATTYYVDANNNNPVPPYTSWSTAATNIQSAVALTQVGDTVEVNPGIYTNGGAMVYGSSNRVALTNAITLLGVDGPQLTAIVGGPQMRCVYVGANAFLSGFTLVNGDTGNSGNYITNESGGGAWCETSGMISNCIFGGTNFFFTNSYAYGPVATNSNYAENGSGDYGGSVYNSTFMGNYGAASASANLYNCFVISNGFLFAPSSSSGALFEGSASNCLIIKNNGGAYGSILHNCTVAENGMAGGTINCTNYNCVIIGNGNTGVGGGISYDCIIASNTASSGAGAAGAVLYNCLLVGNTATMHGSGAGGGGAYECTLYNCTVVSNSTVNIGGGVNSCSAYNCIIYDNSGAFPQLANYDSDQYPNFAYCDTYPYTPGPGIITNGPAFADPAAGDYELASNSPCINSGDNLYVSTTNDLAGNQRISGGTVDIGAYEYQNPSSILSYAWAQEYGLPTDGSADYEDSDGTGMPNWQKSIAELNPTNSTSVLALSPPAATNNASGIIIMWQSVQYLEYYVQRSSDLITFTTIGTNIIARTIGTTSYTDTTATNSGPYFYRIGVQ